MAVRLKHIQGSLCWGCKKAGYTCRKPVEGWDADYNPLYPDDECIPSWFVRACPNFDPDEPNVKYVTKASSKPRRKHHPSTDDRAFKRYDIFGESLTAREISERYGIRQKTFRSRLERGWTPEEAATGEKKKDYILKGTNVKTKQIKFWFDVNDACDDKYEFTSYGISDSLRRGYAHRGWIFEKEQI